MMEYPDDSSCDCIADEDEELCVKMSENKTCPIIIRKNKKEKEYMEQMKKLEKEKMNNG